METLSVHIKGVAPLLMNRFQEEQKEISKKKQKVYDDNEEANKRLYLTKDNKLYQPSTHLKAGLVKTASAFKFEGRKTYKDVVKSDLIIDPVEIIHINQKWEIDKRSCVVQRARIMRVRPILKDWELKFKIQYNPDRLTPKIIKELLEDMGRSNGLGDLRPEYGRFEIITLK